MLVKQGRRQASEDRNDGHVIGEAMFTEFKRETHRREERNKQEVGPKKSKCVLCLLPCSTFDPSAWKTNRKEEKTQTIKQPPTSWWRAAQYSSQGLANHSCSTSSVQTITAKELHYDFRFLSHATPTDSVKIRVCFRLWVYEGEA